jgi:hypothetical protein
MTKYKIVANPISGRGNGGRHIPDRAGRNKLIIIGCQNIFSLVPEKPRSWV